MGIFIFVDIYHLVPAFGELCLTLVLIFLFFFYFLLEFHILLWRVSDTKPSFSYHTKWTQSQLLLCKVANTLRIAEYRE